jgi:hypothetical protein
MWWRELTYIKAR